MAQVVGISGSIASASGTQVEHLLDTGIGTYSASFVNNAPQFDNTEFSSSGVTAKSVAVGIYDWTLQVRGRFPKGGGQTGHEGFLAYDSSGAYALHQRAWTLNLNYDEVRTTAGAASPPSSHTYVAGAYGWSGSFQGGIDDTTVLSLASAAVTGEASTIKLTEEGATDNQFTGAIHRVGLSTEHLIQSSNPQSYTYNFAGTGPLTVVGSSNVLPSGAVPTADASAVTFTIASGQTLAGSVFLSQLSITWALDQLIDVQATLRGSGALTPA